MRDDQHVVYSIGGCDTLSGLLERLREVEHHASVHANRPIHAHEILMNMNGNGSGTLFLIAETDTHGDVTYVVQLR